jgi:hypothetical protein
MSVSLNQIDLITFLEACFMVLMSMSLSQLKENAFFLKIYFSLVYVFLSLILLYCYVIRYFSYFIIWFVLMHLPRSISFGFPNFEMTFIRVSKRPVNKLFKLKNHHHHQPINVPTAWAQAFLMSYT